MRRTLTSSALTSAKRTNATRLPIAAAVGIAKDTSFVLNASLYDNNKSSRLLGNMGSNTAASSSSSAVPNANDSSSAAEEWEAFANSVNTPESRNVAVAPEQVGQGVFSGIVECVRVVSPSASVDVTAPTSDLGILDFANTTLPRTFARASAVLQIVLKLNDTYAPTTEVRKADGTIDRVASSPDTAAVMEEGKLLVMCPLTTMSLDEAAAVYASGKAPAAIPAGTRIVVNGAYRTIQLRQRSGSADTNLDSEEGFLNNLRMIPFAFVQLPTDGIATNVRALPPIPSAQ